MPHEHDTAFNSIVTRHYERILKFCAYALDGNLSLAQDCAQDIFLILYENMGKLKDYDRIGGWLYKTAGHISKRYAASLRKERARFAPPPGGAGEGSETLPEDLIVAERTIKTEEEELYEKPYHCRSSGDCFWTAYRFGPPVSVQGVPDHGRHGYEVPLVRPGGDRRGGPHRRPWHSPCRLCQP
jgi:hypothetical protein